MSKGIGGEVGFGASGDQACRLSRPWLGQLEGFVGFGFKLQVTGFRD